MEPEKHSELAMKAHQYVTEPMEKGLMKIGVNSAWKAGLLVAGISSAVIYYIKPAHSFDQATGRPRPWVFFYNPGDKDGPEPTYFPFWFTGLLFGYGFSLVI